MAQRRRKDVENPVIKASDLEEEPEARAQFGEARAQFRGFGGAAAFAQKEADGQLEKRDDEG